MPNSKVEGRPRSRDHATECLRAWCTRCVSRIRVGCPMPLDSVMEWLAFLTKCRAQYVALNMSRHGMARSSRSICRQRETVVAHELGPENLKSCRRVVHDIDFASPNRVVGRRRVRLGEPAATKCVSITLDAYALRFSKFGWRCWRVNCDLYADTASLGAIIPFADRRER